MTYEEGTIDLASGNKICEEEREADDDEQNEEQQHKAEMKIYGKGGAQVELTLNENPTFETLDNNVTFEDEVEIVAKSDRNGFLGLNVRDHLSLNNPSSAVKLNHAQSYIFST